MSPSLLVKISTDCDGLLFTRVRTVLQSAYGNLLKPSQKKRIVTDPCGNMKRGERKVIDRDFFLNDPTADGEWTLDLRVAKLRN